jgi:lipoate-protein ligase A
VKYLLYIENRSTDPFFNLALEEYFFKQAEIKEDILIIWQNEPVIVVGKNQDTLSEINLDHIEKNNIKVVRRITGGGAVYHDMGNINFSIIKESGGKISFEAFTAPLIGYLKELGIEAVCSGRNDILIDGKKISGNAQCYHGNKVLHHGTLLFDSDLGVLSEVLNPRKEKLESKHINSVKSRVANISDHLSVPATVDEFKRGLIENLCAMMTEYEISEAEYEAICDIADSKYRNHEWNYGNRRKMNFTNCKKFDAGLIEIKMNISDGIIQEIDIEGDFFEGTL